MRVALILTVLSTAVVGFVWADVWWESTVIYQIYPRSFKDSDGNGIGDLNGIKEKLPYLKETGVDAIWLSPIYLSPMHDFGYDITNYTAIDPVFGTMQDFDNIMTEAKRLGIRVVLDYVPNHTSNESQWFIKSARREEGYSDYYIWADGKNSTNSTLPPNNWVSTFRKSAWELHPVRGQYYLHQFVIGQPDLNYRNNKVQEEMMNVLRFWLNKGVSGFRVDAVNMMYEVDPSLHGGKYPDEPESGIAGTSPDDYEYLNHTYTKDQDETYEVVYNWRALLDNYTVAHNESKVFMTESYANMGLVMRYYGNQTRPGSVPFNFFFLELNKNSSANDFKSVIDNWMSSMPAGKTANWVNGNHDQSRVGTRQGVERIDAMNMLALMLPGITLTYQGEEIGMTDVDISWEDTKDPQACNTDDPVNYWKKSRDPARTPFQWDNTTNAGFSNTTGKTWLPIATNYREVNLAAQKNVPKSHYTFYKDVVAIKKMPSVRRGALDTKALSSDILVVTRRLSGYPVITGIINLSNQEKSVNLSSVNQMPAQLKVVASGVACSQEKGVQAASQSVNVSAHCAIVLQEMDATQPITTTAQPANITQSTTTAQPANITQSTTTAQPANITQSTTTAQPANITQSTTTAQPANITQSTTTAQPANITQSTTTAQPANITQSTTTAQPANITQSTTTAQPANITQSTTTAQPANITQSTTTAQPANITQSTTTAQPANITQSTTTAQPANITQSTTTAQPANITQSTTTAQPANITQSTTTAQPANITQSTTTAQPANITQSTTTAQPANITQSTTTAQPANITQSTTTAQPANITQSTTTAQPAYTTASSSTTQSANSCSRLSILKGHIFVYLMLLLSYYVRD